MIYITWINIWAKNGAMKTLDCRGYNLSTVEEAFAKHNIDEKSLLSFSIMYGRIF